MTVFAGLILNSVTISATEIKPSASLAMHYTDNASKVADNEQSDLIVTTRVGASIDADSGPFQLAANTSLKHVNYTHDTFEHQSYFSLNATANWEMWAEHLDWQLQDYFTQQSINALDPNTPDNIRDTNVLTFGPTLNLRISGRQSLTINPEYRQYTYEAQNIDNQQNSLALHWNYQLFRTLNVGLRGGTNKVDYDEPLLPDNTFSNIHLTLAATRADYSYSVDLGSTRVEKASGDSLQGLTGSINWSFDISGHSNLHSYIASQLTDANTTLLNVSVNPDNGDFLHQQISTEIFRDSIFRLNYKNTDATINSTIWMELRKQNYAFALLDQDVQTAGIEFNYPLTARLATGFNSRYSQIHSADIGREDQQYQIDGNLNYKLSRRLQAAFNLQYFSKDSNLDTADFNEWSFLVSLVYGNGS